MKKNYSLYLDLDAMELLKSKGVNISNLLSSIIEVEAGLIPGDKIDEMEKLKISNIKLIAENKNLRDEIARIKKETDYDKRDPRGWTETKYERYDI